MIYYSKLVKGGLIDMPTLVSLTAANPAKIIGDSSGSITVGQDADMLLFDPNGTVKVENVQSLYDGEELNGEIVMRFKKGEPV